jgi:hypothetical protein
MKAHSANTNFEEELCGENTLSYETAIKKHPVYQQLQFLPLLYRDPEDIVIVSSLPPIEFSHPKIYTLSDALQEGLKLESWGYSASLSAFAKKKNLIYERPLETVVRNVHSKGFCQQLAPRHAQSCLLYNQAELENWIKEEPFPKVLKKTLSHGGRGHLLLLSEDHVDVGKISSFATREWEEKRAVRAERWLDCIFEFSTQWHIQKDGSISLLGSTVFESSKTGSYMSTIVGEKEEIFREQLPFLEEHLHHAKPFLMKVVAEGYFGNIGLDALLYKNGGKTSLYPITEANARKTMSYAALLYQRRHSPKKTMRFSFVRIDKEKTSLLPLYLEEKGRKKIDFQRGLYVS